MRFLVLVLSLAALASSSCVVAGGHYQAGGRKGARKLDRAHYGAAAGVELGYWNGVHQGGGRAGGTGLEAFLRFTRSIGTVAWSGSLAWGLRNLDGDHGGWWVPWVEELTFGSRHVVGRIGGGPFVGKLSGPNDRSSGFVFGGTGRAGVDFVFGSRDAELVFGAKAIYLLSQSDAIAGQTVRYNDIGVVFSLGLAF